MLAVGTPGALAATETEKAPPEILAQVNDEPVSQAELQRMLADPVAQSRFQQELGAAAPERKELERLALRDLIHRRLLLQEADRRHFKVTEDQLDLTLAALRRRFPDLESFGAWMHERGLDDKSLFDAIRTDLLVARVKAALVEGLEIPETEIRDYFAAHGKNLVIGEEVRLKMIAVPSQAAAEEILAALRKGTSFGALAQQRSLGKRADQGGDLGWVPLESMPPAIQLAVGGLQIGDIAGPLRKAEDEFLIIGLAGRRPHRTTNLAEAQTEIERRLRPPRQEESIRLWLAEQEKNSNIKIFIPQQ